MILVRANKIAFRWHVEEMDSFRRAHAKLIPGKQLKMKRADNVPLTHNPPHRTDSGIKWTNENGREIVVSIWKTELPKGSQN